MKAVTATVAALSIGLAVFVSPFIELAGDAATDITRLDSYSEAVLGK